MIAKRTRTTRKIPTIAEVARLAGVSPAVASRALSGKKRPISEDKRQKVVEAAEQLGYRPNPFAQSLVTNETNLVSVVVNHIADLSDLELFDKLIQQLQEHGKQVIIVRLKSAEMKKEFLHNTLNYHVDAALIFSDFLSPSEARDFFKTDKVIMLNGKYDEQSYAVFADDSIGIGQAVAHAKKKGVKNAVVIIGRRTNQLESRRVDLYGQLLSDHDISVKFVNAGDYSYKSGARVGRELIKKGTPDAIFCTSDALAMGVYDVVRHERGLSIPQDVLLFGFDNSDLADLLRYEISSIGHDKDQYVQIVTTLATGSSTASPFGQQKLLPTRFFPKSTG